MKRKAITLVLLMAATALGFVACDPKDEPAPPPEPISLAGCTWSCDVENTMYIDYGQLHIPISATMTAMLDLIDDERGELFEDYALENPMSGVSSSHDYVNQTFNYFFDGSSMKLTFTDNGVPTSDQLVLTYNTDSNTFTMPINDSQLRWMLSATNVVLHQTRGGNQ